jgi:hypothetical protein
LQNTSFNQNSIFRQAWCDLKATRTDDWKSMKQSVNNDNCGRKSSYSELLPVMTVDAMNGVVK